MRRLNSLLCTAACSLIMVSAALADVSMPTIFGQGMVLQQGIKLPVWGWAAPGENVKVELAGKTVGATANDKGEWRVDLPAMTPGGPHTLTVTGTNTLTFGEVLVGEVWVCSGQSNMEFALRSTNDSAAEIATADLPKMRLFRVTRTVKGYPDKDVPGEWQVCTPETVPGFTAVGFLFGRRLHKDLGVPVGLIESSWGGTRIEPWTPPEGFAAVPRLKDLADKVNLFSPWTPQYKELLAAYITDLTKWQAEAAKALAEETETPLRPSFPGALRPPSDRQHPTALYNGMIHGFVPYGIRGAIWYQGESNRNDGLLYLPKMQALVKGWRTVWGQGDFPFYFVQLAPYNYGGSPRLLPRIWEAQTRASVEIPNTGMAVINDVGNLKDIHPRNKQDVADRLVRIALAKTYGKADIQYASPSFAKLTLEGPKAIVQFKDTYGQLSSRDDKPLTWFEIVDAQKGVLKAEAKITSSDTVEVTAPEATEAVGVRFAWHQSAEPNLVNAAGLPAGAFRAGDMGRKNDLEATIPAAKGYTSLYVLDIPVDCGYGTKPVVYATDNSANLPGLFDRVAYCLELKPKDKPTQYVFVSMDAFTKNAKELGVPTVTLGKIWQQDVSNLIVASKVPGVPTGESMGTGRIEFWPSNYGPKNETGVPGASNETFDFGDSKGRGDNGYGSMQIHLPSQKTTLFSFNRWGPGGTCEMGIGNSPQGNPDWTFTSNAASYETRRLTVLVRIDE